MAHGGENPNPPPRPLPIITSPSQAHPEGCKTLPLGSGNFEGIFFWVFFLNHKVYFSTRPVFCYGQSAGREKKKWEMGGGVTIVCLQRWKLPDWGNLPKVGLDVLPVLQRVGLTHEFPEDTLVEMETNTEFDCHLAFETF